MKLVQLKVNTMWKTNIVHIHTKCFLDTAVLFYVDIWVPTFLVVFFIENLYLAKDKDGFNDGMG